MPERPREISRCERKISCMSERSLISPSPPPPPSFLSLVSPRSRSRGAARGAVVILAAAAAAAIIVVRLVSGVCGRVAGPGRHGQQLVVAAAAAGRRRRLRLLVGVAQVLLALAVDAAAT